MHHSKTAFLVTLSKILSKSGKNYAYASQASYLDCMKQIHDIEINDRCLRKHLLDLVKQGYIKSVRRWGRSKDGTIHNKTSAICLTPKGCLYLVKQGVTWALSHLKKLTKYVKPLLVKNNNLKQVIKQMNKKGGYIFKDDMRRTKERLQRIHKKLHGI